MGPFFRKLLQVKCFEPFHGVTYDPYFRVTLGTREENAFFLEQMAAVLAGA